MTRLLRKMEVSLFFFADSASAGGEGRYDLLLDSARFADDAGLCAVWTPERHFHRFGGLYASPAVTGAAVAAITRSVGVRAGSVVLPLHDPVRVAEEWAMIDNLSSGRVGLSVASGWHAVDFVLHPRPEEGYRTRREELVSALDVVRRLWRGESVERVSGSGEPVRVEIFPKPLQPELPLWVTSSGNPATFELAGRLGANVLTHLLGQGLDSLRDKVTRYRQALRDHHPDRGPGTVTCMIHTLLGDDDDSIRETIRQPFGGYLAQSLDLITRSAPTMGTTSAVSEADRQVLVDRAFERYWRDSGLFGSVESAMAMCAKLRHVGIDEVACLIDFGVARSTVARGLEPLAKLAAELKRER
jgi:natural product biosynthesis luciferase-like monooxygenase protein